MNFTRSSYAVVSWILQETIGVFSNIMQECGYDSEEFVSYLTLLFTAHSNWERSVFLPALRHLFDSVLPNFVHFRTKISFFICWSLAANGERCRRTVSWKLYIIFYCSQWEFAKIIHLVDLGWDLGVMIGLATSQGF